jgi:hypothetical protein
LVSDPDLASVHRRRKIRPPRQNKTKWRASVARVSPINVFKIALSGSQNGAQQFFECFHQASAASSMKTDQKNAIGLRRADKMIVRLSILSPA